MKSMPTPGYYKTNIRAATLSEMIRMRGWLLLPLTFLGTKFFSRPTGGVWMPTPCAETDCAPGELSARFWEATQFQRATLERLGFGSSYFSTLRRNLNPMYLDDGSVTYLHANHSHIGTVVYGRLLRPALLKQVREVVVVGITAVFERQSITFTNSKDHLDPLPGRKAVLVQTADPAVMYEKFACFLASQSEQPRVFAGVEGMRQWLDERRLESFEARVGRGLYVRMTDQEVQQARQKMAV
jgi:hypothetical protein